MKTDYINIWGLDISTSALSVKELTYLTNLPESLPALEWVWHEMDRVWEDLGLNNKKPLLYQPITEFYRHPVWLMNGLFSALDPLSVQHREAIAFYISTLNASIVADYGGGFGELALRIAQKSPDTKINVIEPYPSQLGKERIKKEPRISYVSKLGVDYDAVVAQDVLEHVEDPIGLAYAISSSLHHGGLGIFANAFYPVIKCHLPANFYLRDSFPGVMRAMGMRFVGYVKDAPHALVFEHTGELNLSLARLAEQFFKLYFLFNNNLRKIGSTLKRITLR